MLIVQGDAFNRSAIATVVCVPMTSNLRWAQAPGNVLLPARTTGLDKDSVANVSQIITVDRSTLTKRVGHLPRRLLELVLSGVDLCSAGNRASGSRLAWLVFVGLRP